MSDMAEYSVTCTAERTESMHKLSADLNSLIDSAAQVNDALRDASSRASRLDAKLRDTLDVIDDSARLAAVLDALCARQPHCACFLWTAARNLVRDVVGHVTSADLQPWAKVTGDESELGDGRRRRLRAAAQLDLFYGDAAHLAYADWLEAVSASQHPSPNHDLCCRLLAHIPLLAAYTDWPTEHQLHVNTEDGTQLLHTTNRNGEINATKCASSDVGKSGSESEDLLTEWTQWRPSDEDKKFIEETVTSSLVDHEDLCRLLMVAMATELEKPVCGDDGDESKPLEHDVQFSSPADHDHGDNIHDESNKRRRPNGLSEFDRVHTNATALRDLEDPPTAKAIEYGSLERPVGDGNDAIVFEDAKSDSVETASSSPSPTSSGPICPEIPLLETRNSNSAWYFSTESFDHEFEKSSRFLSTSGTLDVELMDTISRSTENREMMKCAPAFSQHTEQTETVESVESLTIQNFEPLIVDDSATNTSRTNSRKHPSVKSQPATALRPLPTASCCSSAVNDRITDADKQCDTNGCISATESRRLVDLHSDTEEKHADRFHQHDSERTEDTADAVENRKSLAEGDRDARRSTENKELQSLRQTGRLEDDCQVSFRPRQRSAIPLPIRPANHLLPAACALNASSLTSHAALAQSSAAAARHHRSISSSHDVKCAARRKTVTV